MERGARRLPWGLRAGGGRRARRALSLGGTYSTRHSDESLSSLKLSVATPASALEVSEPLSAADASDPTRDHLSASPQTGLTTSAPEPPQPIGGQPARDVTGCWPIRAPHGTGNPAQPRTGRGALRSDRALFREAGRAAPHFRAVRPAAPLAHAQQVPRGARKGITRPPSAANDAGLAGSVRTVAIGLLEREGGDRRGAASYWPSAAPVPSGPSGHWVAALPVPRGE